MWFEISPWMWFEVSRWMWFEVSGCGLRFHRMWFEVSPVVIPRKDIFKIFWKFWNEVLENFEEMFPVCSG